MTYTIQIDEAQNRLRELIKPEDRIYTIVRHVSRSGMLRVISVLIIDNGEIRDISWLTAKALDTPYDRKREGLRVSGAGMDMAWHQSYLLGLALFDNGYALKHTYL